MTAEVYYLPLKGGFLVKLDGQLYAVPNVRGAWEYRLPVDGPEPVNRLSEDAERLALWTLGVPGAEKPSLRTQIVVGAEVAWFKAASLEAA